MFGATDTDLLDQSQHHLYDEEERVMSDAFAAAKALVYGVPLGNSYFG